MQLSIKCTLIVHNVSKLWLMQSQSFIKPLTKFQLLPRRYQMQSFRKRMMFNINSDISDVPTTGKISVTTNKQLFWKQKWDKTGDSRLFISLCFRYRPFLFIYFFFGRPFLCRSGQCSFFCIVDKSLNRQSSNILFVVGRSSFGHFNCS